MSKTYVLYNPLSRSDNYLEKLKEHLEGKDVVYIDMTGISDYAEFFEGKSLNDDIIICGGDGTLNRFINDTQELAIKNNVMYYACGTGNDFLRDLGKETGCAPFRINEYIKNLPTVTVKGHTYKFLNGVGFGIDGYCCEVGDKLREKSDKPVNYTAIAVKGLLFHYKPTTAVVTVDGTSAKFKKVWLAPTMHGRYYGGGMMPTPMQKRNSTGHTVSVMIFHGAGKLRTLKIFPSIFKGEHIKYDSLTSIFRGKDITVKFDRPVALQIDGETIRDVSEYNVKAYSI